MGVLAHTHVHGGWRLASDVCSSHQSWAAGTELGTAWFHRGCARNTHLLRRKGPGQGRHPPVSLRLSWRWVQFHRSGEVTRGRGGGPTIQGPGCPGRGPGSILASLGLVIYSRWVSNQSGLSYQPSSPKLSPRLTFSTCKMVMLLHTKLWRWPACLGS